MTSAGEPGPGASSGVPPDGNVGREVLVAQLRALRVRPGATVMLHASMRAVGPVDGGAEGLLDAVLVTIGEEGTLLMVAGAADEHDWVNERPVDERAALLADALPFDPRTTPADPDVGVLAEVFRRRLDAMVNDHPDGRFVAVGAGAAAMLGDGPWHDYYGTGSALDRLVERGGVVVRLGADENTITLTHLAEFRAQLAWPKVRVARHHRVLVDGRPTIVVVETFDDSDGISEYDLTGHDPADFPDHAIDEDDGTIDEFAAILHDYRATGAVRTGIVGGARAELIEAEPFVRFAVEWIETHARRP